MTAVVTEEAMAQGWSVSPVAVVVGALVAVAVLAVAGPRGRGRGVVGRRVLFWTAGRAGRDPAGAGGADAEEEGPPPRRLPAWWPWGAAQHAASPSVQVTVTQVAGLLRAGIAPGQAWQSVGQVRVDPQGVPDAEDLAALVTGRRPDRKSTRLNSSHWE